ncbi:MAG: HAMP domain-containing sensor histidine kinase [Nannocystaceae bacterium]
MTRLLPRGISGRVVFAAALCAALSVAIVGVLTTSLMIGQSLRRLSDLLPHLDPLLLAECERDPAGFAAGLGPDLTITAYDPATLEPSRPGAPAIDRALVARLEAGEPSPSRFYWGEPWGGGSLRRAQPSGPCGLVMLRWGVGVAERRFTLAWILGLAALSVGVAVILASAFAVRPILSRIERLRRATQAVGREAGYASAEDEAVDDLGQLSRLLDQAHARIKSDGARMTARHRALEEHLAAVAHDLRTPLASLYLALEDLSQERCDRPARLRGAIDDVVYMGALIDNLHLACRLQEGADPLEGDPRVDLGAVVDSVSRRFAALGARRSIEVHGARPDAPVWARASASMAEQAIANLVHNAVAHGDPGGHVAILLEVAGDRFVLRVIDDGPGVPPVELPRIGERTFRGDDARQRDPKGSGLGLAITGEVCRRAGFTLGFEAEAPQGLRVTLSGPRVDGRSIG